MTGSREAREREVLRAIADGAVTHAQIRPHTAYENIGNVLIVCQRLQKSGYVTSHITRAARRKLSAWHHGPNTRHYQITDAGRVALVDMESNAAAKPAQRSGCVGQE